MSVTNFAKYHLIDAGFDLAADTIKVMLLNTSHTTNVDTQEYIDDVSANQVSGTGYTAGGATLTGKSITKDNTNNRAYFDAADVTWSNTTLTNVRYAVIYKDTGTPGTSPILCIKDLGQTYNPTGANFTISWNSGGILRIA